MMPKHTKVFFGIGMATENVRFWILLNPGKCPYSAHKFWKKSQKYETHKSIILPNNLLISYIVFKWQSLENLKWIVNLIDRKNRMNVSRFGKISDSFKLNVLSRNS